MESIPLGMGQVKSQYPSIGSCFGSVMIVRRWGGVVRLCGFVCHTWNRFGPMRHGSNLVRITHWTMRRIAGHAYREA